MGMDKLVMLLIVGFIGLPLVMGPEPERKSAAARKTWIVDVRDLNSQHVCTGSLVSREYVLVPCSCVVNVNSSTHQREKLKRIVISRFQGVEQERRSANHFPHLLCEPVGKSGRPVHNYAVTLVAQPFDVPELDVLPLTTEGRVLEKRLLVVFKKPGKCESVGWTIGQRNGITIHNLTSFAVEPALDPEINEKTWLVGRAPFSTSPTEDGSPGRVLICEGQPYGFLDSWSNADGVDRYYRLDHIVSWVISMTKEA